MYNLNRVLTYQYMKEAVSGHVFVIPQTTSTSSLGTAQTHRQAMLDEVNRIIKAVERTLTNIKWAYNEGEVHRDIFDAKMGKAELHTVITVRCEYVRTS